MKKIIFIYLLLIVLFSCQKEQGVSSKYKEDDLINQTIEHGMIVLGKERANPYALDNMQKAIKNLYPTRSETIEATDVYLRFLPKTDEEYNKLKACGLYLMDHPLNHDIVKDGDYYHDPTIPNDKLTWQYTVIKSNQSYPKEIEHEVLSNCIIPDRDLETRSSDLNWDAIEEEAFRISGNSDMIIKGSDIEGDNKDVQTRGLLKSYVPRGRITIEDKDLDGGEVIGVSGVTVVGNVFVRFLTGQTDKDGYYQLNGKFTFRPRYRLLFDNVNGFKIGFNAIIIPASFSNIGVGSPKGRDYHVTPSSNRKLFTRCVVNNACYDYIERCKKEDLNILRPPYNLRIWLMDTFKSSDTYMFNKGCLLTKPNMSTLLGKLYLVLQLFLPDVVIGLRGQNTYSEIYGTALKQFAKVSYYANVGNVYWKSKLEYMLKNSILAGNRDGVYEKSDLVAQKHALAEMWAKFMQSKLYYDRYGHYKYNLEDPSVWYKPEIFGYLFDRGISISEIFYGVTNKNSQTFEKFRERLIMRRPDRENDINQIFIENEI